MERNNAPILQRSILMNGQRRNTPTHFFPSDLKPHTSCSRSSTLGTPFWLAGSAVGAMGEFCGDFSQPANWIVLILYADLGSPTGHSPDQASACAVRQAPILHRSNGAGRRENTPIYSPQSHLHFLGFITLKLTLRCWP